MKKNIKFAYDIRRIKLIQTYSDEFVRGAEEAGGMVEKVFLADLELVSEWIQRICYVSGESDRERIGKCDSDGQSWSSERHGVYERGVRIGKNDKQALIIRT